MLPTHVTRQSVLDAAAEAERHGYYAEATALRTDAMWLAAHGLERTAINDPLPLGEVAGYWLGEVTGWGEARA